MENDIWKFCVYLITLGMLISLLMGESMSWTAIAAALVLIVLDFKDAQPCLEKVVLTAGWIKTKKRCVYNV